MTRNSSVHFLEKNMTMQIFTKKNNVWFINFSCMCQRTCFWFSNHKPVQSAAVCVKNRTWYYRGISKRPVKIKGFREVLRSSLSYCQHFFFGICCLMWLVKTVSYLKSNTSRFYSRKNDWKGTWKSEAHSESQTRTLTGTSQHYRPALRLEPQIVLMVHLNSKCHLDPQAEDITVMCILYI